MFNNGLVSTSNVGNMRQILADVSQQVSVGCIVPQELGVQVGRRMIVKAGTPIKMNYMNTFEPVSKPGGGDVGAKYKVAQMANPDSSIAFYADSVDVDKFISYITAVCGELNYDDVPSDYIIGDWFIFDGQVLGQDGVILKRGYSESKYKQFSNASEMSEACGIYASSFPEWFSMHLVVYPDDVSVSIADHSMYGEALTLTGSAENVSTMLACKLCSKNLIVSGQPVIKNWGTMYDLLEYDTVNVKVTEVTGTGYQKRFKAVVTAVKNGESKTVQFLGDNETPLDSFPAILASALFTKEGDNWQELASCGCNTPSVALDDEFTFTIEHGGASGGNGAGGAEYNAILLHDVDVTFGTNNGTALLCGVVNLKRVEDEVREEIESNLEGNKSHVLFIRA